MVIIIIIFLYNYLATSIDMPTVSMSSFSNEVLNTNEVNMTQSSQSKITNNYTSNSNSILTIIVLGDNTAVIIGYVVGGCLFIITCVIIGIILVLVQKRSRAKTSLVVRSGTVNVTCNSIIIINLFYNRNSVH